VEVVDPKTCFLVGRVPMVVEKPNVGINLCFEKLSLATQSAKGIHVGTGSPYNRSTDIGKYKKPG
jgi:hypothetical protein